MTDGEIRVMYRQAKNPDKQVRILAELNTAGAFESADYERITDYIMQAQTAARWCGENRRMK